MPASGGIDFVLALEQVFQATAQLRKKLNPGTLHNDVEDVACLSMQCSGPDKLYSLYTPSLV